MRTTVRHIVGSRVPGTAGGHRIERLTRTVHDVHIAGLRVGDAQRRIRCGSRGAVRRTDRAGCGGPGRQERPRVARAACACQPTHHTHCRTPAQRLHQPARFLAPVWSAAPTLACR